MKERINVIEEGIVKFQDDIGELKGIVQVQDRSISANKSKITDLMVRSMKNNIVIFGLEGDSEDEQDCKQKVLTFLCPKLTMEVKDEEVEVTHRVGKKPGIKNRQMVVRCKPDLRQRIFKFTKNFKNQKNNIGEFMSVKTQLPEPLLSEHMERENKLREIIKANAAVCDEEKHRQ